MNFKAWADAPDKINELADHLGVTRAAVYQWRDNGVPIPRMAQVVEFTGRQVTVLEMVEEAAAAKAKAKAEKASA